MFNRKIKTRQYIEKCKNSRDVTFLVEDKVLCGDYRNPNKRSWQSAVVVEVLGTKTYLCK